jgi:hypothetical protein
MDGRWSAELSCDASADQPASVMQIPVQIQFREVRIEQGQIGLPGYFRAYGQIGEDGNFQLQGTSLPKTQRIVGNENAVRASGRTLDADRMEANATIGKRNCSIHFSRISGQ